MGWTHETVRKSRLPAFLTSHAPPYTLPLETGEVFAALAAEIAEGAEFTRLQTSQWNHTTRGRPLTRSLRGRGEVFDSTRGSQ